MARGTLCHRLLKRWYAEYNQRWFRGRLPADADVFYAPLAEHAVVEWEANGEVRIQVDTAVAGTRYARMDLLHEMNHLDTRDRAHGARFQAGMQRLAREGAFRRIW